MPPSFFSGDLGDECMAVWLRQLFSTGALRRQIQSITFFFEGVKPASTSKETTGFRHQEKRASNTSPTSHSSLKPPYLSMPVKPLCMAWRESLSKRSRRCRKKAGRLAKKGADNAGRSLSSE